MSDAERLLQSWRKTHRLTSAEVDLVRLSVNGVARDKLAEVRHVAQSTVKKQVQVLLGKTGHKSFLMLVLDFMRTLPPKPKGEPGGPPEKAWLVLRCERSHPVEASVNRGAQGTFGDDRCSLAGAGTSA